MMGHEDGNFSDSEMQSRVQAIIAGHLDNPYLATYFNNSLSDADKQNRI